MCVKIVIPKQNSPVSAIRKYCVECSGGGRKEVAECNIYRCPLFPYRFGMMPDTYISTHNNFEIVNTKGEIENGNKKTRRKKDTGKRPE